MREIRKEITAAVLARLLSINVYSVEQDDLVYPYTIIDGFNLTELSNKDSFYYYGIFQLTYKAKGEDRNFSLIPLLDNLHYIKSSIQRYKGDVLVDGQVYLKLIGDTDLVRTYNSNNEYISVLTYEFKINS